MGKRENHYLVGTSKKGVKYDCFQQKKSYNCILYLHVYGKRKIYLMVHRHRFHRTQMDDEK